MWVRLGWVLVVIHGREATMGFLGGLFGRSADRKIGAKDRCNECGMTEGTHTGWCSDAAAEASPPAKDATVQGSPPDEASESTPAM